MSTKPIDLYYWPTPNGWKISIMLEECNLAYNVKYVDIAKGEQFEPSFLAISPNNRMPAIVDHDGPGGEPIAIFESGAILQYLGNKTGLFYPAEQRRRSNVEQWLFWQMGGLGPMAGQAHHFTQYAREKIPYAIDRYIREVTRLYTVMDTQLSKHEYLAGDYSIADMACFGWIVPHKRQGQSLDDYPALKRWFHLVGARKGVKRGMAVGEEKRKKPEDLKGDKQAHDILFGAGQLRQS